MKIELSKKDLASLVKGTTPNYSIFDNPLVKQSGKYTGGFKDEWTWNYGFENNLTEQQLWELYTLCRDSFN